MNVDEQRAHWKIKIESFEHLLLQLCALGKVMFMF